MLPLINSHAGRSEATSDIQFRRREFDQDLWYEFYPKTIATSSRKSSPIKYQSERASDSRKIHQLQLSQQIKALDRKIRRCQLKIKRDRIRLQVQQEAKFIHKLVDLDINNQFGFITNPQIEEYGTDDHKELIPSRESSKQVTRPPKLRGEKYINETTQLLEDHYVNDLKKKFERRSKVPHRSCRRKIPKLNITQLNKLQRSGYVENQEEHLYRVFSKQATPVEIYPSIPTFSPVKDSVSKNIVAYLADYKPFIQKVSKVEESF